MAGATTLQAHPDRSQRFEARAATREPRWVKWTLIAIGLAYFGL